MASLATHNPFDPWNPVTPPHFLGRLRELRQLQIALEEGRSVSVVGDWRIGKSSLLKTWAQIVIQRGHLTLSLSGEDSAAQSLQTFIQTITGMPASDEPDQAADVLADWVAQEGRPGLSPALLVDEVGACLKLFPARFFERLRGMLGKITLVLASHRDIDSIYTDLGHTSPFGNRLSIVRLGLLEPEIPNIMIHWAEQLLTVEAMHTMRIWAGRHPFYLQLLGYHLVSAEQAGESLACALDAFYDDANVRLRRLWETLSEREQQALRESLQGKFVTRRSLRIRGLVTEEGKPFGEVLREWLEQET